jgi:hypothetical protein
MQTSGLTWSELYTASRLAKWSGLTYYPSEVLPQHLESQGLTLVAQGTTPYTQWFIADGCIDYEPPISSALRSLGPDAGAAAAAASPSSSHSYVTGTTPTASTSHSSILAAATAGGGAGVPGSGVASQLISQGPGVSGLGMSLPSQRRRFVFVRGVSGAEAFPVAHGTKKSPDSCCTGS